MTMTKQAGVTSIVLLATFIAFVGISTALEHHKPKKNKEAEEIAELVLKDYSV